MKSKINIKVAKGYEEPIKLHGVKCLVISCASCDEMDALPTKDFNELREQLGWLNKKGLWVCPNCNNNHHERQ